MQILIFSNFTTESNRFRFVFFGCQKIPFKDTVSWIDPLNACHYHLQMITSGRIYTKKHITGVSSKPKSRFRLDILPTQKRKQFFSVLALRWPWLKFGSMSNFWSSQIGKKCWNQCPWRNKIIWDKWTIALVSTKSNVIKMPIHYFGFNRFR